MISSYFQLIDIVSIIIQEAGPSNLGVTNVQQDYSKQIGYKDGKVREEQ